MNDKPRDLADSDFFVGQEGEKVFLCLCQQVFSLEIRTLKVMYESGMLSTNAHHELTEIILEWEEERAKNALHPNNLGATHCVIELSHSSGMWDFDIEEYKGQACVFQGSKEECQEYTYNWRY